MSQSSELTSLPNDPPTCPDLFLSLLKIPVSDVSRAAAFYRDVLGFEELFVVPEYGWAQLRTSHGGAPSLPLALYVPGQGGGDRSVGGSVDFHLSTSDLEALGVRWSERERESGEAAERGSIGAIITGADGTRFLEVTDPDGNVLKVVESL